MLHYVMLNVPLFHIVLVDIAGVVSLLLCYFNIALLDAASF